MEAEQASLSCIVVDATGDPIAQVCYRCSLCRRICDSSTDAMLHFQIDHIDWQSATNQQHLQQPRRQQQQQQQQQQQHQQRANFNQQRPTVSGSGPSAAYLNQVRQGTVTNSNKRPAPIESGGSLLKKVAPSFSASSNSLLKKASNMMRAQEHQRQQQQATSNGRSSSRRIASVHAVNAANASASDVTDSIHRKYSTTSASRAAKRYSAASAASSTSPTKQQVRPQQQQQQQQQPSRQVAVRSNMRVGTVLSEEQLREYKTNLVAKANENSNKSPPGSTIKQESSQTKPTAANERKEKALESAPGSKVFTLPSGITLSLRDKDATATKSLQVIGEANSETDQRNSSEPEEVKRDIQITCQNEAVGSPPELSSHKSSQSSNSTNSQDPSSTPKNFSQSAGSQDSAKSYSLRPRSLTKKRFRDSP